MPRRSYLPVSIERREYCLFLADIKKVHKYITRSKPPAPSYWQNDSKLQFENKNEISTSAIDDN